LEKSRNRALVFHFLLERSCVDDANSSSFRKKAQLDAVFAQLYKKVILVI